MPNRLELRGITKRFPGGLANDDVSFAVKPGEIHALLGENGAGKSTLVKMIYGIMQPDAGEILWNGQPVAVPNPKAARRLGTGMVSQHFSLFEALTVLENIALGMDAKIPARELEARIREVMHSYGLALDPHRTVATLSVGERQRIEIVRALLLNPSQLIMDEPTTVPPPREVDALFGVLRQFAAAGGRRREIGRSLLLTPILLIMDEPASVLTPQEVDQLFAVLRQLAVEGCSILYISHKRHEIKALCDTATILRGGRLVDTCDPKAETSRSMAEKMIGAGLQDIVRGAGRSFGAPKLVVSRRSTEGAGHFDVPVDNVTFAVRAGEILGIAGVAGNGQNALLDALSGEVRSERPD